MAMGIGYSMFLVDPEHPKVKDLEVFEPVEAVTEPVNQPETDNGKGNRNLSLVQGTMIPRHLLV